MYVHFKQVAPRNVVPQAYPIPELFLEQEGVLSEAPFYYSYHHQSPACHVHLFPKHTPTEADHACYMIINLTKLLDFTIMWHRSIASLVLFKQYRQGIYSNLR